ncbi:unnamed protein product [Wuchereria bancrofti]|uniref:Uncharacterized protein n=1 Tax=Wuchereria bancrofti TaxID=6293 RepID=A0A3P7G185_WUCBA|nr:unnamed protein product [Wuchereria bancrofti]
MNLNIAIGTIILSNFVAFLLDILISMPIQNITFQLLKDEKCDTSIDVRYAHIISTLAIVGSADLIMLDLQLAELYFEEY